MEPIIFHLQGEFVELNNLLKLTGLCQSGGAGKMIVAQGLVSVDGAIETRKTCKIKAGQKVNYQDHEIHVLPSIDP